MNPESSFAAHLQSQGKLPNTVATGITHEQFAPHGTTIVALRHANGVLMAGDRRATMGNIIAQRDIQKVFPADTYSLIGIAGSAGIAIELVRLFQVELEHYEKIEGTSLSLNGKANRLSSLLRSNLGLAMQGLTVVPLLAGFDNKLNIGRIFSYDVTGGRYEEHDFYAVGSGSQFARGALKKINALDQSEDEAIVAAIESLFDAADDDSATGGPDISRGIFPVIYTAGPTGVREINTDHISQLSREMLQRRSIQPNGPRAKLTPGGEST